jgi:hypothetical protein
LTSHRHAHSRAQTAGGRINRAEPAQTKGAGTARPEPLEPEGIHVSKSRKLPGASRRYVQRVARTLAALAALAVYALAPLSGRWPLAAATLAAAAITYGGIQWAATAVGSAALSRAAKK